MRTQAKITLEELADESVIPDLVRLLKNRIYYARHNAALMLGQLKTKSALDDLQKALSRERHKFVYKAIKEAIEKIEK